MSVTVIEMQIPQARCCLCGRWDLSRWGVPISLETGLIIANDSPEEWAGKPACERCWREHEDGKHVGKEPKF